MEKYEKPTMEVIELLLEQSILQDSGIATINFMDDEDVDDSWR